jgi:hypothetical protein
MVLFNGLMRVFPTFGSLFSLSLSVCCASVSIGTPGDEDIQGPLSLHFDLRVSLHATRYMRIWTETCSHRRRRHIGWTGDRENLIGQGITY